MIIDIHKLHQRSVRGKSSDSFLANRSIDHHLIDSGLKRQVRVRPNSLFISLLSYSLPAVPLTLFFLFSQRSGNMFCLRWMVLLVVLFAVCEAAKKTGKKEPDPKECEVCVSTLEKIDSLVPKDKKKSKAAIEEAINKHCTSGSLSGSDWKPNPALTSPRDVKMCYMFEPIKKAISQPFSTGMPKKKVCERLKKDNPEICEIKYRKF